VELNKQSGFDFVYDFALIEGAGRVDINVKDEPMKNVLDIVLSEKNLSYTITGNIVTITMHRRTEPQVASPQQQRVVNGRVTDIRDHALSGVNVRVEGQPQMTRTDDNGHYRIAAQPGQVLQFSFVGYRTLEVPVPPSGDPVNVVLLEEVKELEDVIVTGYNLIDRQSFTGSVVTISREDLLKASPSNILSTLQLFDPSFKMMDNNELGSDPNN